MSFRNRHPPCVPKKAPPCCPKKPRCPKTQNSGTSSDDPCASSRGAAGGASGGNGCPNYDREQPPNNNNENGGKEALAGMPAPREVEKEVDRLVDCARAWSEKEKFKLKQYYEEEMVRKKKAIIQEFKCAMEREVIAPLKTKLCEYEREVQQLRLQLQQAGQPVECPQIPSGGNEEVAGTSKSGASVKSKGEVEEVADDSKSQKSAAPQAEEQIENEADKQSQKADQSNENQNEKQSVSPVDLQPLQKALQKARKSQQKLQRMIHVERQRKNTIISARGDVPARKVDSKPGEKSPSASASRQQSRRSSKERWAASEQNEATQGDMANDGMTSKRNSGQSTKPVLEGDNGITSRRDSGQSQAVQKGDDGTTSKRNSGQSTKPGQNKAAGQEGFMETGFNEPEDGDEEIDLSALIQAAGLHDDVRQSIQTVIEIVEGLSHTAKFTEEQIEELMREQERNEKLMKEAEELRIENEELKRRIQELLAQLEMMTPKRGSVDEENMQLRQRIQQLESERTRGSLQSELELLKRQLEDVWEKNEEEKEKLGSSGRTPDNSKLGLIPEEDGDLMDGGHGSTLSNTPGDGLGTPGSALGMEGDEETNRAEESRRGSAQESVRESRRGSAQESVKESRKGSIPESQKGKALSGKASGQSAGGQKTPKSVGSGKAMSGKSKGSSTDKKRTSKKSAALSARSMDEITGPFESQIKLLLERIKELEDHLNAMEELEVRLKELEEQTQEMEKIKQQLVDLQTECEELRARECNTGPVISETELRDLRQRLEDTERQLAGKIAEMQELVDKVGAMEQENEELTRSVASFKQVEKKTEELETIHAQVLEEKRRKSAEANQLSMKVSQLEQEHSRVLEDIDEMRAQLDSKDAALQNLEDERRRLQEELETSRTQLNENSGSVDQLKKEIQEKTELLEELRSKNEKLQEEADSTRKRMEDAIREKEEMEKELETMKRQCEEAQNELMRQLRESQKRCADACDALSKKGQCILEHEKKCMNVTSQMEKDNQELQEKLRQMQAQLDSMMDMERRTRMLHGEMDEFYKRAQERSKELEELKKLPETCDLKGMDSNSSVLPSPLFSIPSMPLPTPSQMDAASTSFRKDDEEENKENKESKEEDNSKKQEECKLLSTQLQELESEKDNLNTELETKLKAVEELNRQLEELQRKDGRLRDEKDKACKD